MVSAITHPAARPTKSIIDLLAWPVYLCRFRLNTEWPLLAYFVEKLRIRPTATFLQKCIRSDASPQNAVAVVQTLLVASRVVVASPPPGVAIDA